MPVRKSKVKAKLARNEPALILGCHLTDPTVYEMVGRMDAAARAHGRRALDVALCCMDAPPMHLSNNPYAERIAKSDDDDDASGAGRLYGPQLAVLDWWLLSRAHALAGLSRLGMFGAHQGHNCPLQVVECVVPGSFARVEFAMVWRPPHIYEKLSTSRV